VGATLSTLACGAGTGKKFEYLVIAAPGSMHEGGMNG
jgi:hypothetical protein